MKFIEVGTKRIRSKKIKGEKIKTIEDRPLLASYIHSDQMLTIIDLKGKQVDHYHVKEMPSYAGARGFQLTNLYPDPNPSEYAGTGPYQCSIEGTVEECHCTCVGGDKGGYCKHTACLLEVCLQGLIPDSHSPQSGELAEGEVIDESREPEPWEWPSEPFSELTTIVFDEPPEDFWPDDQNFRHNLPSQELP